MNKSINVFSSIILCMLSATLFFFVGFVLGQKIGMDRIKTKPISLEQIEYHEKLRKESLDSAAHYLLKADSIKSILHRINTGSDSSEHRKQATERVDRLIDSFNRDADRESPAQKESRVP